MRVKDKFLEKINFLIFILSLCLSHNLNAEKIHQKVFDYNDSLKNSQTEGLVYFLLSKFIIIYEAWMFEENKAIEAPSLIAFMDLVKDKGERPWQLLY